MLSRQRSAFAQPFCLEGLKTINGISFTPREMDIMACLLSARSSKKIAYLLSISERTVETYIRNLMYKLECNSREGISDFVERAAESPLLRKYYQALLIKSDFEKHLSALATSIKLGIKCGLIYEEKQEEAFMDLLQHHLDRVGVKTILISCAAELSFEHIYKELGESVDYLVIASSFKTFKSTIANDKPLMIPHFETKSHNRQTPVIFLIGGKQSMSSVAPFLEKNKYVDFTIRQNYYVCFFNLLKALLPHVSFEPTLSRFVHDWDHRILPTFHSLAQESSIDEKQLSTSTFLAKNITPKIQRRDLIALLCMIVFGGGLILLMHPEASHRPPFQNPQVPSFLRADLAVPAETILLPRRTLLADIDNALKQQHGIKTLAIVGMGGAGKTILARYYAQQNEAKVVWELNAESLASTIRSYEHFAYGLARSEEETIYLKAVGEIKDPQKREEKILAFVKAKLLHLTPWLLIYDNVENLQRIHHYMPTHPKIWGEGTLLVTTRDSTIDTSNSINVSIHLSELTAQEKYELFTNIITKGKRISLTESERQDIERFLSFIPPFPLEVSMAAYYLKATQISHTVYLERLKASEEEFDRLQGHILQEVSAYSKTRYAIIRMSLEHLINEHPDFKELVFMMALMDAQQIPRALLEHIKRPIVVDNFLYSLKKYSFITDEETTLFPTLSSFSLHRSIQEMSLLYLTRVFKLKDNKALLLPISEAIERYSAALMDKEAVETIKPLLSHVEKVVSHSDLLTDAMQGSLKSTLGCMYYYLSFYDQAKHSLDDSITHLKRADKKNSAAFAQALLHRGIYRREMGHYQEARDDLLQSLHLFQKHRPQSYSNIARTLAYLGLVYRNLGDSKKACATLEQSLALCKEHLPANHSLVPRTLAYLAHIYRHLERYDRAQELFEQSLFLYKAHFPENKAGIAWALTHLGNVYRDQGKYEKARICLEQSVSLYKTHLLENHSERAWALGYLGDIYRELGQMHTAKRLFKQSLVIYNDHLSGYPIGLAWDLAHLGDIYRVLGNLKKARELLERSHELYQRHFSKDVAGIAWNVMLLGKLYRDQKDYEKAVHLLKQSLIIYEKHYGSNHFKTAQVVSEIGHVYLREGRLDAAEVLFENVRAIYKRHHRPEIIHVLESFAYIYRQKAILAKNKGSLQQAEIYNTQANGYLEEALTLAKAHFPADCPYVIKLEEKHATLKREVTKSP